MGIRKKSSLVLAAATATALVLSACSGAGSTGGGSGDDENSITVLMVGNPQMEDIQKLTAEHFTKDSGINVRFTILPENELRDKVTQDVANQGGQYDVVTIGAYEVPIWSKNGWLNEVSTQMAADTAFDQADLLKPMVTVASGEDGKMYGVPFYGESSLLMYNKEIFEAKGLTMPERPTWAQVADLAAKADDKDNGGPAGICLRGLPGWGEGIASLTTIVNTFGGTWFEQDWTPKLNAPEFKEATEFYVNLAREHGQPGPAQSGFVECLGVFSQGKSAMWYDATSAAGTVEDPNASQVAGKVGYVYAPVNKTEHSGWLWSWDWAMPKTTKKADAAWKFISWASSKEYETLVGEQLGWSRVPAGKRTSTYSIPEYKESAAAFADLTLDSIANADPSNPGLQPRPAIGVQFVAIPEFTDLGTKVSQQISAALTGEKTVDEALAEGQKLAEAVAKNYQ